MSSFRSQTGVTKAPFWSIERVVAILTPVFGALSGWLTGWIGTHFPGLPAISAGDLTALEIAGFMGAAAAALKWLHGRQKYIGFTADIEHVIDEVTRRVMANQVAGPAIADIEAVLKTHTSQIVEAIERSVHAPPAVEQIVDAMVARLVLQAPAQGAPAVAAQ